MSSRPAFKHAGLLSLTTVGEGRAWTPAQIKRAAAAFATDRAAESATHRLIGHPSRGTKIRLTTFIRGVFGRLSSMSPWNNEEPFREELFSVERLEEHARSLAVAQPVTPKPSKGHPLAARLADNGAILLDAYRNIVKAIDEGRAITPAAEWLIDNYHLVERQIREIRSDLPPGYYRQLPKLADGPFRDIRGCSAWPGPSSPTPTAASIPEMLGRYVRAYQEVQPLTIGELWAVSITLRIVLIENLRRLAEQIVRNRAARQQADGLADRLLGAGGRAAEPVAVVLADHARPAVGRFSRSSSCTGCATRIPGSRPALTWLDQRLAAQGTTADAVVRDEHQRQGAANVTVRNIITSMRLISDVDWTELFERISLVDDVLAAGSAFRTWISRPAISTAAPSRNWRGGSNRTELDIARSAVLAAKGAAHHARRRGGQAAGAIRAIICSPADAAPSKPRSASACHCANGRRA